MLHTDLSILKGIEIEMKGMGRDVKQGIRPSKLRYRLCYDLS